jgi:hypothetical protein
MTQISNIKLFKEEVKEHARVLRELIEREDYEPGKDPEYDSAVEEMALGLCDMVAILEKFGVI